MAFLNKGRAHDLIRAELGTAKVNLACRLDDLKKARAHVAELEQTCAGLEDKVAGLERDQKALDRGYIAMMCGNAAINN